MQPDSIRIMGDKATARETMKKAGVPTVPGSDGLLQVQLIAIFFICTVAISFSFSTRLLLVGSIF